MRYKVLSVATIIAVLFTAGISCFAREPVKSDLPALKNIVRPNKEGVANIPETDLMDYIIPNSINGEKVTSIGTSAFSGCDYFRSITIPAEITEIGANAFSDCKNLEHIILEGRSDTSSMTLGDNWSGNATVYFEYVAEDTKAPDAESSEKGTIHEGPSDKISDRLEPADESHDISESAGQDHSPTAPPEERSVLNHTDAGSGDEDDAAESGREDPLFDTETTEIEKVAEKQQEGGTHQDGPNRENH